MIKISLPALLKILIGNKIGFVIEKASAFEEKLVYRFVVAHSYPSTGPHISIGSESNRLLCQKDRVDFHGGRVILHYDVENQEVLSMCQSIHQLLMNKKREGKRHAIRNTHNLESENERESEIHC